jgi:hypothetical protein
MIKALILVASVLISCSTTINTPDINLSEQKKLNPKSCSDLISTFDNKIKSMANKTLSEEDVDSLRAMNVDQLECLIDRYVLCESEYEGCRNKVNKINEKF